MCTGLPHGGLGNERISGQGVTDRIRATTFAAWARGGQERGHTVHDACALGVDTRRGICASIGCTDVY